MSNIKSSNFNRREKVVAAREMALAIPEQFPADAVLGQMGAELLTWTTKMADGYVGLDTRLYTTEVEAKDAARDRATRALNLYLRAIRASDAHAAMWAAADELLHVLAADGLDWLQDAYNIQTLRQNEIIDKLKSMPPQIETCRAGEFVAQIVSAQAAFEAAVKDRGQILLDKPEIVARINRSFELSLRSVLLRLEALEDSPAKAVVLEPFARLSRKSVPSPSSPAPAPVS
jgi:hypothetical protein